MVHTRGSLPTCDETFFGLGYKMVQTACLYVYLLFFIYFYLHSNKKDNLGTPSSCTVLGTPCSSTDIGQLVFDTCHCKSSSCLHSLLLSVLPVTQQFVRFYCFIPVAVATDVQVTPPSGQSVRLWSRNHLGSCLSSTLSTKTFLVCECLYCLIVVFSHQQNRLRCKKRES